MKGAEGMKRYKYKNIVCFQEYGRWHADYQSENGRFGLHGAALRTKADCYELAKEQVDYLNEKEG